jgi:predicted dehydrogenase
MPEKFPVAIAGAGLMGAWHARYAQQCGASVYGVMDNDRSAAERLAAKCSGARAFTEINGLLECCHPRVVHICTPIESHVSLAEAAFNGAAHVLMEKPLTHNAAVSRDLLSSAAARGLLLTPVHQFLFQRGFLAACTVAPTLGRILHVDATFCSAGGERVAGSNLDEIAADILPHPLALIERLVPGALAAIQWHAVRTLAGEWRATGAGHDLSASILVSLQGRPTECSLRIVTDGGVIQVDLFHGFATVDTAPASKAAKIGRPFRISTTQIGQAGWNLARRLIAREFAYPGLRRLISEFYAAVRDHSTAPISADEIMAVAVAREDLIKSIAHSEMQQGPA